MGAFLNGSSESWRDVEDQILLLTQHTLGSVFSLNSLFSCRLVSEDSVVAHGVVEGVKEEQQ